MGHPKSFQALSPGHPPGFDAEPDEETRALFQEMNYLEKSIGKTGKLALLPFLHVSGKELWQLYMIGK